ncbi:hypothetical protein GCM10010236_81440 [Streptomyces eurythermus]|nr:hypothetical protein GCM10010236_81440 [Streptomyces eurythermus]
MTGWWTTLAYTARGPGGAVGEREGDVVAEAEGLAHPVVGVPEFTAVRVERVQTVGGGGVAGSCGVLPPPQCSFRLLREVEQAAEVQGAGASPYRPGRGGTARAPVLNCDVVSCRCPWGCFIVRGRVPVRSGR